MTPSPEPVSAERLQAFIARSFTACGMPPGDAGTAAGLMARADLMGQDGHGVFRLPMYVRRIRAGGMDHDAGVHPGAGPRGHRADRRRQRAGASGDASRRHPGDGEGRESRHRLGWRMHSNHAGPASLYAMMPLERDMIGLYIAVGSANHLPPWGGTEMLLSTNPIAVAVPSGKNPPIVLDMATTVAAYGKVKTAAQRGERMPEGWMIDRTGAPLTDPQRAAEGFLLPIGGPKGYGLALIFGILAGTLNGAAFGRDVVDFNADSKSVTNTGHLILALDIAAFTDPEAFRADIDRVWAEMKSSPRMEGVEEIRLPGERLHRITQERRAGGIPLSGALREQLAALAAELGIDPL